MNLTAESIENTLELIKHDERLIQKLHEFIHGRYKFTDDSHLIRTVPIKAWISRDQITIAAGQSLPS